MRRISILLAAACAAMFLLAANAQANAVCDQMRGLLTRGGGSASGLIVVEAESGDVVCARAAGTPRLLASNMKLFTTATALSRLGPGEPDRYQGAQRRQTRLRWHPPRQPLPAGRGRPHARYAGLLQQLPGRPRHQPLRPGAADPRRRDPLDHRPPLRRRHDLRPPAWCRRLRLRHQLLHRPTLRPRLQLRLRRLDQQQRLLLRPGQAGGHASSLARSAPAASPYRPRSHWPKRRPRPARSRSSAPPP